MGLFSVCAGYRFGQPNFRWILGRGAGFLIEGGTGGTQYYVSHPPIVRSVPPPFFEVLPSLKNFFFLRGLFYCLQLPHWLNILSIAMLKDVFKRTSCLQITIKYTIIFDPIVVMESWVIPPSPPNIPNPPLSPHCHSLSLAEKWIGNPAVLICDPIIALLWP